MRVLRGKVNRNDVAKDSRGVWMVMEDSKLGGSVPNVRENLVLKNKT